MRKICLFILLCLTLSACNIADKRVAEFRTLTEQVEHRGERFTTKEWRETYQKYNQLLADFDDLQLTEEQADTVFYLKQRFRKACVHSSKEAAEGVFEEAITTIVDETTDIFSDVVDNSVEIASSDSSNAKK